MKQKEENCQPNGLIIFCHLLATQKTTEAQKTQNTHMIKIVTQFCSGMLPNLLKLSKSSLKVFYMFLLFTLPRLYPASISVI